VINKVMFSDIEENGTAWKFGNVLTIFIIIYYLLCIINYLLFIIYYLLLFVLNPLAAAADSQ